VAKKKIIVADCEADGLLYAATKVHCICTTSKGSSVDSFTDDIQKALDTFDEADLIVFHAGCSYDLPLLEKLYGWTPKAEVVDTHILSRLNEPDRIAGHSIEAWAKQFGMGKVGADITDWSKLTEDMLDRCRNDARVGWKVFEDLNKRMGLGYELLG